MNSAVPECEKLFKDKKSNASLSKRHRADLRVPLLKYEEI